MYYFTDDCLIGVEQIDEEHRELFRIVGETKELLDNEILDDKYDKICEMLGRLGEYAEEHFRHEEEYMEEINHPELELQRKQHLEFCAKMDELDAVVGGHDQQEFLDDLLTYLVRWLYRHIIGSDLMIGRMKSADERRQIGYDFTEEYLTGVELVDEEHKELFRIIGQVHEMIANEYLADKYDEIISLVEELRTYTKVHFKDEEEYLESIQYEGLEAQRVAHEMFVSRMYEIDLNEIDAHQEEVLQELMSFLTEWLVNHILHMDKKFSLAH